MNWTKKCRLLAEKSQTDIAKALGMHINTYARKEKEEDKFTIAEVKIIARETGGNAADIFLPETLQM